MNRIMLSAISGWVLANLALAMPAACWSHTSVPSASGLLT